MRWLWLEKRPAARAGKHLVILSGWSNDGDALWQQQIAHLAEVYEFPTLVVSTESSASHMASEVLRRAPKNFILLGHSFGGFIAQHVALQALNASSG